jgi:predicted transcriptional regulator
LSLKFDLNKLNDSISILTDIIFIDMNKKPCVNINGVIPFLKSISDENRLKIICFLKKEEKCVCDIVEFMQLPQNLVSHHLKKLRDENIVISKKE